MKLTDILVRSLKPGEKLIRKYDGGGLCICVTPKGSKYWQLSYRFNHKPQTYSIGSYPIISLKEAREMRDAAKKLLASGTDPNAEKKRVKSELLARDTEFKSTVESVANEWFERHALKITDRRAKALRSILDKKVFPAIGQKRVTECEPIDFLNVAAIDEKAAHYEAAYKVMSLCNQFMEYARITGRVKYNVAARLSKVLITPPERHFAAITEPEKVGQLLRDIDEYQGHFSVIYFLKILPHVFTRPSELRLAQWSEIDWDNAVWNIPANRMKMAREHLVPLSRQVIAMLNELKQFSYGEYLFPSIRSKTKVIADATALFALRRMGYTQQEATLHGFRTTASTLLNELDFRPDIIEAQLAHRERNKVRAAYNRAEYLPERRKMMEAWSDHLDQLKARVGCSGLSTA